MPGAAVAYWQTAGQCSAYHEAIGHLTKEDCSLLSSDYCATGPLVIEHIADDLRRLLDLGTRHIEMRNETHTVLVHCQG